MDTIDNESIKSSSRLPPSSSSRPPPPPIYSSPPTTVIFPYSPHYPPYPFPPLSMMNGDIKNVLGIPRRLIEPKIEGEKERKNQLVFIQHFKAEMEPKMQ